MSRIIKKLSSVPQDEHLYLENEIAFFFLFKETFDLKLLRKSLVIFFDRSLLFFSLELYEYFVVEPKFSPHGIIQLTNLIYITSDKKYSHQACELKFVAFVK